MIFSLAQKYQKKAKTKKKRKRKRKQMSANANTKEEHEYECGRKCGGECGSQKDSEHEGEWDPDWEWVRELQHYQLRKHSCGHWCEGTYTFAQKREQGEHKFAHEPEPEPLDECENEISRWERK